MTLDTWIARTPDAAADARALEAWLRAAPDGACVLDDDGRRWWCWRVGAARAVRWFERPGEFGQTPESLVRSAGRFEPAPERSAPPARPRGPAPTRPSTTRRRAPGRRDRSPRGEQRRRVCSAS